MTRPTRVTRGSSRVTMRRAVGSQSRANMDRNFQITTGR